MLEETKSRRKKRKKKKKKRNTWNWIIYSINDNKQLNSIKKKNGRMGSEIH